MSGVHRGIPRGLGGGGHATPRGGNTKWFIHGSLQWAVKPVEELHSAVKLKEGGVRETPCCCSARPPDPGSDMS